MYSVTGLFMSVFNEFLVVVHLLIKHYYINNTICGRSKSRIKPKHNTWNV